MYPHITGDLWVCLNSSNQRPADWVIFWEHKKKSAGLTGSVCNLSYSGDGDWEDHGSRPVQTLS
jgi:hypothetical protein